LVEQESLLLSYVYAINASCEPNQPLAPEISLPTNPRPDISILEETGHFYLALTAANRIAGSTTALKFEAFSGKPQKESISLLF
jgi:hypothetical protein